MQGEQDDSSEPSLCASDDSDDVGIIENGPLMEDDGYSLEEKTDHLRSLSMEIGCLTEGPASVPSEMLPTLAIEGLKDPDQMHDNNDNIDIPSCHENPTSLPQDSNLVEQRLPPDTDTVEDRDVAGDDVHVTDDNIQTEPYEQKVAKRLRLTPLEGEGLTGSLSKDLHF